MAVPTIPQFFEGKHIFITGATGFMGKVLVEKLLRSCKDLDTIYILVRGKKGKSAEQRWTDVCQLPCFDRLKNELPGQLESKVKILEGDVKENNLGLSAGDYALLVDKVDIIFHVAASVRFNDPLHEAVKMNTCGTKYAVELAAQAKNLLVFLHVSTTYCYCNLRRETEEIVYPTNMAWKDVVKIAENVDPISLQILSQHFTDFSPNTYVYSKALAEQIIDEYKDRVPAVIVRPSIVISSWKEPMPGWIDNFNGPVGLIIAAGKGVVRVSLCDPDGVPDYMAVDVAIKGMLIAAYKKGISRGTKPLGEIDVYNSSSTSKSSISNRKLIDLSQIIHKEFPINEIIWLPSYDVTKSFAVYRLRAFFSHYLVALIVDTLLRIFKRTPMLLKIHIKIHNAVMALGYFTTKEWTFNNDKFLALNNVVPPADKESFDFSFDGLEPIDYFRIAAMGGRKYLLNEDLSTIPNAKKKIERLKLLSGVIKWTFYTGVAYYVYGYISSVALFS
uniref:Fatty acyl-CoA reductase n=3 Tax=Lygus hesperus TaxID=30085 RepID=A0A0A9Y3V1_LYGHE